MENQQSTKVIGYMGCFVISCLKLPLYLLIGIVEMLLGARVVLSLMEAA